jgi:hypothetical protein
MLIECNSIRKSFQEKSLDILCNKSGVARNEV